VTDNADAWSMPPEAATEKLAQLTKDFAVANGQAPPPSSTPTVEDLLAAQEAAADARDAAGLTAFLTETSLPAGDPVGDDVMRYANQAQTITPELRAAVEAKIASWGKDREFMRRLFDGSAEEKRLLTIASAMLTAPVGEAK
jgi:hypothetical protein